MLKRSVSVRAAVGLASAFALVVTVACGLPARVPNPVAPKLDTRPQEFTIVSYNVKALPPPLVPLETGKRLRQVAAGIAKYDVALLQEMWTRPKDMFGGLAPGSVVSDIWRNEPSAKFSRRNGIAVISRLDARWLQESVIRYFDAGCSGVVSKSSDCGMTKGFNMRRIRFDGMEIDFYSTHFDAGGAPSDHITRLRQLEVLRSHIAVHSNGRPVVLAGDFNISRQKAPEWNDLRDFANKLCLTDAGIVPLGAWSQLDYIFYRSSDSVSLSLTESGTDDSFQTEKSALSDHPAIFARIRVVHILNEQKAGSAGC